ncbi:MAG: ATP-dependent DNA helicase RecQ [Flavobacteriales bacterium]
MADIHQILKSYWGFDDFRPLQEDIIRSVMEGANTVALLPTGGGKSLCYQVPGMAMDGVCIVISPLIALMKDQVESLQEKGIPARALVSGMKQSELDRILDKAVHQKIRFLFVSPERTRAELFRERFEKMRVNLLAVDEAHCISQWGYDFRPSYLRIAEIRELQPSTPFLALTATATPQVVDDIRHRLGGPEAHVFRKSFERKKLAYIVRHTEDKGGILLRILQRIAGTSIVYARSRKRTERIAGFLKKKGISAAAYHAGIDKKKRQKLQQEWLEDRIRVMVATNAFGMGIDKPDVRSVVHMDLPDSPEAYFQEAGRAGRDGKKSYAVLLFHEKDEREMAERNEREFPPFEKVREVYEAVCQKLRIAYDAGTNETYPIDLFELADEKGFKRTECLSALKILEWEDKLAITLDHEEPPMVRSRMSPQGLYDHQVRHPEQSGLIELLLRSYEGLFDEMVPIDEKRLAERARISVKELDQWLQRLSKNEVLEYQPREGRPRITLLDRRLPKERLQASKEGYHARKEATEKRRASMLRYATTEEECRSRFLLAYFGEENAPECGICDICLDQKKSGLDRTEFQRLEEAVHRALDREAMDVQSLQETLSHVDRDKLLRVIRWNLEQGYLEQDDAQRLWNVRQSQE